MVLDLQLAFLLYLGKEDNFLRDEYFLEVHIVNNVFLKKLQKSGKIQCCIYIKKRSDLIWKPTNLHCTSDPV